MIDELELLLLADEMGVANPDAEQPTYPIIRLDWEAYYHSFVEAHGEPVRWKGKLLFPDAWTYGLDYMGPEWPPPDDPKQRDAMILAYWLIRRRVVKSERDQLADLVNQMEQLQHARSMPLIREIIRRDDEGGQRRDHEPLDLEEIKAGRLAWLNRDLARCNAMIAEMRPKVEAKRIDPDQVEVA